LRIRIKTNREDAKSAEENAKSFATDQNQMHADQSKTEFIEFHLCSSDFDLWQKCISSRSSSRSSRLRGYLLI